MSSNFFAEVFQKKIEANDFLRQKGRPFKPSVHHWNIKKVLSIRKLEKFYSFWDKNESKIKILVEALKLLVVIRFDTKKKEFR